ncbi:MAG: chemotaxis protein CheD [Vicinamibacterales bacterium]
MSTPLRVARPGAAVAAAVAPRAPTGAAAPGRRLVVGIGEFAVSNGPEDLIVTHALGSCVSVTVADPVVGVAGLIHVLLPDSKINPQRAAEQPAAFADTGLPIFVQQAVDRGLVKKRAVVTLAGGAEIANAGGAGTFNIGKRNILAVKNLLWKLGLLIKAESVGGTAVRTVHLSVGTGRVKVTSGTLGVLEL